MSRGDEDRTFAVALAVRDRHRAALSDRPGSRSAFELSWATGPAGLVARWHVLLAALAGHEFEHAGLRAPAWTLAARLETAWVLDTPRLSDSEVRAQTPTWLAERNVFIAIKDLGTL